MKPASASHDTHGHDESLADDPDADYRMTDRILAAGFVLFVGLLVAGALVLGSGR